MSQCISNVDVSRDHAEAAARCILFHYWLDALPCYAIPCPHDVAAGQSAKCRLPLNQSGLPQCWDYQAVLLSYLPGTEVTEDMSLCLSLFSGPEELKALHLKVHMQIIHRQL